MINKKIFSTARVLLVEDEKENRKLIDYLLKDLFEEVVTAVDGQDGLNKFKSSFNDNENNFNVIITDINMPIMNGIEMIQKIRQLQPTIPIVIISAYNDDNSLEIAKDLNINDYIIKPINIIELIKVLEKILKP